MRDKSPKSSFEGYRFSQLPSHFLIKKIHNSAQVSHFWKPPTDVYESENEVQIRVEVAGLTEDDFSVQIVNQTLFIQGKRDIDFDKCALHQIEIPTGEFQIAIKMSFAPEVENCRVDYQSGFIKIYLPKIKRTINNKGS